MVDIESWMKELAGKLTDEFGSRLLFLGLQGSYGRGEATEDSDIDVVTVLDEVELADLDAYRAIVSAMPEGEKACGFLCGGLELKSWPKYDLLGVARDTRDVYGSLAELLPPLNRNDWADAVAVGASGLYHAAVHTYLYGEREKRPQFLANAHKSIFVVLRAQHALRPGENVRAKKDLLTRLSGDERKILECGLTKHEAEEPPEAVFARLLRWSASAMAEAQDAKIP
ncbi:MAG: nucleotidyltransferase domain-containing protein [Oscillospiraceae bacterium]|nr:nucleotidyltransferase domain-containing protein [Oscillospiraceae bacterium]